MLTKDLVQYRTRQGKVHPGFVDVKDAELAAMAADLIELYAQSEGKTAGELETELGDSAWAAHPRMPALRKLLADRCDEAEDSGEIAERRWQILTRSEALRTSGAYPTLAAFQAALGADQGVAEAVLRDGLYNDLPEHRRLTGFKTLTPLALLHRHNCAQVQGLLVHATQVEVTLTGGTLGEKRRFFRCLKFQRLLSDVSEGKDGRVTVQLSGPMKIFQNTQSYGLRLANFFPYVLQMPAWELSAALKMGAKTLSLSLDQKVGIASHYKDMAPYVPPELTAFINVFNERGGDWRASASEAFLHLGKESYCFPDVTFTNWAGAEVHLEIFHRLHAGQLLGRLRTLDSEGEHPSLLIGVADELRRDPDVDAAVGKSAWFNRNGFSFKTYPTPKAALAALARFGVPAGAKAPAGASTGKGAKSVGTKAAGAAELLLPADAAAPWAADAVPPAAPSTKPRRKAAAASAASKATAAKPRRPKGAPATTTATAATPKPAAPRDGTLEQFWKDC